MSAGEASATPLHDLVDEAVDIYGDDSEAVGILRGYRRRMGEPLRIALAGMVKAGKSTLLNAMIGEEIAPTDAGECTRIVTWYRYGDTPGVTLELTSGVSRALAITREEGRLVFDLGTERLADISRIVVDWPAQGLRGMTLIDTPGIASLSAEVSERSSSFLVPRTASFEVDAVVYLLRHLHAADINFLESFRDLALGPSRTVNALAVLSRADEVGSGRIDALVSARDIAERYRHDDTLRRLVLGVVPVAGLLAQTARTLRQTEFAALVEIAGLDRDDRERLLISADRFARPSDLVRTSASARSSLLLRFGIFGIRLAAVLINSGISDAPALSRELSRRSGLDALVEVIDGQFWSRAVQLQTLTVLTGLQTLVRERPREGAERIAAQLERFFAEAHEIRELQTLANVRARAFPLSRTILDEAERLLGGTGVTSRERLGLNEDAAADEIRSEAVTTARRWRQRVVSPLTDHATAQLCETVVRSCEAIVAAQATGSSASDDDSISGVLALGVEPSAGSGEEARQDRRAG